MWARLPDSLQGRIAASSLRVRMGAPRRRSSSGLVGACEHERSTEPLEDDDMERLENGDRLPSLTAPRAEGGSMTLPDDVQGAWALVAFYRGHW